ncbi:hypothetical protein JTE90_017004, partial [Oedothorax gibbosus]
KAYRPAPADSFQTIEKIPQRFPPIVEHRPNRNAYTTPIPQARPPARLEQDSTNDPVVGGRNLQNETTTTASWEMRQHGGRGVLPPTTASLLPPRRERAT